MSKDKLTDYSATNSLNTDVGGVNIDEGMLPSDVNNALREVMTHLKDFAEGTQAVNNIRFAGATTTGDINFGDNDKAVFGASSNLSVYFDGSNSYVDEQGSGGLLIRGTNLNLTDSAGVRFLRGESGGPTRFYHQGTEVLTSTATGADITGTLTADGLTVDGDATISSGTPTLQLTDTGGTNQFATLKQDGSNLKILSRNNTVSGGILMRRNVGGTETDAIQLSANGDISFYDSTGTTQGFFWDASTQRLGLGTTSPATKLDIDAGNVLSFGDASYGVVGGVTYPGIVGGAGNILFANKNYGNAAVGLGFYNSGTYEPVVTVRTSGNVGIGTAAPSRAIHVVSSGLNIATFEASNGDSIDLGYDSLSASRTGDFFIDNRDASGNNIQYRCGSSASHIFNIGTSEVVRIDSNERFLVGKTAYGSVSTDGTAIDPSFFQTSASNDRPMLVNRNGTDGNHIEFFKAGSPTGSIGTNSSRTYIGSGSGQSGIKFNTNAIVPAAGADGANSDNTYDLGISSARFKNLYLNNVAYLQNIRGVNDTDSGIDVNGTNIVTFRTGGSERARVTSTGQLLVGQTTNQAHLNTATGDGLTITQSGEINQGTTGESMILNRRGSDGIITRFRREGNSVGSINVTASGTTYNTTSDLRLKENIEPLVATDKLMAMNPVSYNWKADPDGPRSMGFIAQEMQEVMPEAVAVGDDEDAMMSMDYGRITPILVSALQDAHRKIEELEQRIADMEAK